MLTMTIREINIILDTHNELENNRINELHYKIHQQAVFNGLAILDSRKLPKEPRKVSDDTSSNYNRSSNNSLDNLHSLAMMLNAHAVKAD